MSYVTVFVLSFIVGAAFYEFRVYPAQTLRNAFVGFEAAYRKYLAHGGYGPYHPALWERARYRETGVTLHDRERALEGLTLYTSGHAQKALLIDMKGRVVHEWALSFREAWPDPPHVSDPVAEQLVSWRMAHLYPNGDLLAIYTAQDDTPWGYGLAKIDKDSNLIWKYSDHVHHDIDIDREGRIYTLVNELERDALPGLEHIEPPFIHDFVVVLDPEGRELKRVSLFEALRDSNFAALLRTIDEDDRKRDYLHSNSVDVVERTIRGRHVAIEAGQVLVSLRDVGAIVAVDLATERVTWILRGEWVGQHDPDLEENGRMLIFDNFGHMGSGGRSRLIELDPLRREVYWEYTGTDDAPFYSRWRSRQQRLPNGNILVTESGTGRIFEVTPGKKIVWQYLSPHRRGAGNGLVAVIMGGQRFANGSLRFLGD